MKPDSLLVCSLFPETMTELEAADTVHRYSETTGGPDSIDPPMPW